MLKKKDKSNTVLGRRNEKKVNFNEKGKPNMFIYRDSSTGRSVEIALGSIHSVKGRTHFATLVLENFSKTLNIKKLLPQIAGLKKQALNKLRLASCVLNVNM